MKEDNRDRVESEEGEEKNTYRKKTFHGVAHGASRFKQLRTCMIVSRYVTHASLPVFFAVKF